MIVPLRDADVETCGGKAGVLGALLRAGFPVPDGFVVPFDSYREAVHAQDRAATPGTSASRPLPLKLLDALAHGLGALGDGPVAVRSSADGEDTVHSSGAGQHESILAVRGVADVAGAVQACWDSLHSPRADGYRAARGDGRPADPPVMAVLVQRLVDAEVSGVMFTPATAADVTAIEASWGLGPSVVGGTVTPDAYRVTADGQVTHRLADKQTRLDRDRTSGSGAGSRPGTGSGAGSGSGTSRIVSHEVPLEDRDRPTLSDTTAVRLARLGLEVAATLGAPQDIEWAITGDHIDVLQARPVTAAAPEAPDTRNTAAPSDTLEATLGELTGTPASQGTATGTARIVRGPGDFARVRRGDVLVCPHTDPAWTPLLRVAAGVLTETGGALSHAAIVARELRIPAVVGIPDVTTIVRDGSVVTVDGATGTVLVPTP